MTARDDLHRRAERIFQAAADLPATQRASFVAKQCDNTTLLREVEALLASLPDERDEFLERPVFQSPAAAQGDAPGTPRIGHYRIRRILGEGGMGTVYEAEQDNPRRIVALKVIRPALTSPEVLRRFEHEAWVLGQLHHPGIAQVFEAGAVDTPHGRQPFFAMEFVDGRPLTQFAGERRLPTRERLDLMVHICEAVQHAHAKGVIHRDLKPANILIDESGQPRILDFGVARVTNSDMQTITLRTDIGQLVGTVPYMSPEQVSGDPARIDTRSDVYSLGVVLYELLSGRLPYDLRNRPIPEAARIIRDEDPSRLSSIDRSFRGDIESIVQKAIEKDKLRRYQTAADMASDIRHYLHDEPILARSVNTVYQLRKFAKRNKALVGGVAAVFLALAIGLVGMGNLAGRERAQRRTAERSAYRSSLAAAAAALQSHDVYAAVRNLSAAPEGLRGWEWRVLDSACDESLATIRVETLPATAVLSADSSTLRVVRYTSQTMGTWRLDGVPRLLDERPVPTVCGLLQNGQAECVVETDRTIRVRESAGAAWRSYDPQSWGFGSDRVLNVLGLSADGRELVVDHREGEARGVLHHVDLDTGRVTTSPEGSHWAPRAYCLPTSGIFAFAIWEETAVRLWDVRRGDVRRLTGHTLPVKGLAASPDGRRLYSGAKDRLIRVWDLDSLECVHTLSGHADAIECVASSPDGMLLASGGFDRVVRLWDARSFEPRAVLLGHEKTVDSLAFSPDNSRLVSCGADNTVRVWDARVACNRTVLSGHTSYVYPVAFSADGGTVASGGWDNVIRLWDADTGCEVGRLDGHSSYIECLAFGPDGSRLASVGHDGSLRLWDLEARREIARHPIPHEGPERILGLSLDRDNRRVWIVRSSDQPVAPCWHTNSNQLLDEPAEHGAGASPMISADGDVALRFAIDRQGQAEFSFVSTSTGLVCFTCRARGINGFSFSPVAVRPACVALIEPDGLRVRELTSGRVLSELERERQSDLFCVSFSPDGRRIIAAGRDGALQVFDVETFSLVASLRGHSSYVWSVAWSPDGMRLASGSGDFTVRIWDALPLRQRHLLRAAAAPAVR